MQMRHCYIARPDPDIDPYHAMIGAEPRPEWLQVEWLLSQFGSQRARQIEKYIEFVQQGVRGAGVWGQLKGQVYLGSDLFIETMRKRLETDGRHVNKEIPRAQRRALAKSLAYYRDEFTDAKQGMAAAYATGDYTLQAIADAFEVHYSTVSRAVNGK